MALAAVASLAQQLSITKVGVTALAVSLLVVDLGLVVGDSFPTIFSVFWIRASDAIVTHASRIRIAHGMTQARLAADAGLSRTTLNQLENGLFPDLGVRKVQALLDRLGLALAVQSAPGRADPIRMAAATASVSYRAPLTDDELIHALITGKIPSGKRPHFRTLLDEGSPSLLNGLAREASQWTKPGRAERNLAKIAREVGSTKRIEDWLKTS